MATVYINKSEMSTKLAILTVAAAILGSVPLTATLMILTIIIGILEE